MKIKSFECPKPIRNYKENTWKVRRLVDELFVPSVQQTSILYCRLLEFKLIECLYAIWNCRVCLGKCFKFGYFVQLLNNNA